MVTIREVAKMAGVSVATVSRVINGNGKVREDTKLKVNKVIEELNYTPNSIAVSLNNKQSKTIGLLLPDITNPFFAELAKGVESVAKNHGYTVILCITNGELINELDHLKVLEQKFVDGIILSSHLLTYENLKEIKIPIVSIDRTIHGNFTSITSNNFAGAVIATEHLIKMGCQKVAHISGPQNIKTARHRKEGYLSVVENLPWFDNDLIVSGDYELETGYQVTLQLLKSIKDIDGIFVGNDLMAVGCLKAIHSLGLKVPDDISVIGFDGISFSKITIPELTTIAQPIFEMGLLATNTVLEAIKAEKYEQKTFVLEVDLIKRDSTKGGV